MDQEIGVKSISLSIRGNISKLFNNIYAQINLGDKISRSTQ